MRWSHDDKRGSTLVHTLRQVCAGLALSNPGTPLTTVALDAVIGAGGVPLRRSATEDDRSEAFYLHPADSAYLVELRAAGFSADGR